MIPLDGGQIFHCMLKILQISINLLSLERYKRRKVPIRVKADQKTSVIKITF